MASVAGALTVLREIDKTKDNSGKRTTPCWLHEPSAMESRGLLSNLLVLVSPRAVKK